MRWRHYSCALIILFASIGLSRADVSYSYVAGNPGETLPVYNFTGDRMTYSTIGGTTSTTGGTAVWTGTPGTQVSIPIYFLETVTPTATTTGQRDHVAHQPILEW